MKRRKIFLVILAMGVAATMTWSAGALLAGSSPEVSQLPTEVDLSINSADEAPVTGASLLPGPIPICNCVTVNPYGAVCFGYRSPGGECQDVPCILASDR